VRSFDVLQINFVCVSRFDVVVDFVNEVVGWHWHFPVEFQHVFVDALEERSDVFFTQKTFLLLGIHHFEHEIGSPVRAGVGNSQEVLDVLAEIDVAIVGFQKEEPTLSKAG
jgi:hypothetical protein